jgi:glycosyltransferase involved in cell wall biosynthesis
MSIKLIYISTVDSAFNSQVVELLKFLKDKIKSIHLIVPGDKKPSVDIDGIQLHYYKSVPDYPGSQVHHKAQLKRILNHVGLDENTIIHTRGHLFAFFASLALGKNHRGVRILADFRGVIIEEIETYYALNPFLKKLKIRLFQRAYDKLQRVDAFSAVSTSLKDYVINRSGNKSLFFINTCLAGSNFFFDHAIRKEYRAKLNLKKDDILLVFSSGGNRKWQNADMILEALKKMNVKILILGSKGESSDQIIRLTVPYKEVANYLNASDIGVIHRTNDVVNKVAAPIKFAEYMACGLPVIANNAIHAVTRIIEETRFGKIINDFDQISVSDMQEMMSLDRTAIAYYAQENFGIDTIGNQYLDCYNQLRN